MNAVLHYEVNVPAHPVSIAFVRRGVCAMADIYGDATADDVALVVTELVTNAIRHAAVSNGDSIDVSLDLTPQGVRGSVRDPGSGFRPDPSGPAPRDDGGFGLLIVDRLARDWGVESAPGRTEVWFELDRRAPQDPEVA